MKNPTQHQFLAQPIAISLTVLILSSGCSTNDNIPPVGKSKHNAPYVKPEPMSEIAQARDETLLTEPHARSHILVEPDARHLYQNDSTLQLMDDKANSVNSTTTSENKTRLRVDIPIQPTSNTEKYQNINSNPVVRVADQSTSTFSIDVDTGAYSNVRRFLNTGKMPPTDAVRIEELLNYFSYDYAAPESTDVPFSIHTELASSPWNANTRLLHIGLKGFDVDAEKRPPANLVFLLDVSGSMGAANKLGLLKSSIEMLTNKLTEHDRVSIVVYAGASGVVLEPTAGNNSLAIKAALRKLNAGGSTNGQAGIELAYAMAEQSMIEGSINRIILATDGDFNVGISNIETLKYLIEAKRESGIAFTTLGFGAGNYNDHLMEQLADIGNGSYAYIDTLNEARKVLSEELTSTLLNIAKDVKIQVEFNPDQVSEYRLLGYVNRHLENEDFANDKVDAGEIGAGHTVTALYEVALTGENGEWNTKSRYQTGAKNNPLTDEVAEVRLRFKQPNEVKSKLIKQTVKRSSLINAWTNTSNNFRFSAAVAGFGQLLRQNKFLQEFTYSDAAELARSAKADDHFGYRSEFVQMIDLANNLDESDQAQVRNQATNKNRENEG